MSKEKKEVKIKFVDFWNGFPYMDNILIDILKERYDVKFSDEPDYIFCS